MEQVKNKLKQIAEDNMISEIRFIDAGALEPTELFRSRQPKDILPDARSIVIAGVYIGDFRLKVEDSDLYGRMSRLTLSGFYWNVVDPLKPLRDCLIAQGYDAVICDGLAEEDGIPLKAAAVRAGLGWQGRNTLLISRKYGSFLALGGIITNADLAERYPVEENQCGSCNSCITICPGNAIGSGGLDRAKCLSNLLEEEGMPDSITEMPDNYFFECDICQDTCPWNRKHLKEPLKTKISETFTQQEELLELFRFESLLNMDADTYEKKILPLLTGVKLSYPLFQRNVRLAYQYRYK